jgi:hypothetical protein
MDNPQSYDDANRRAGLRSLADKFLETNDLLAQMPDIAEAYLDDKHGVLLLSDNFNYHWWNLFWFNSQDERFRFIQKWVVTGGPTYIELTLKKLYTENTPFSDMLRGSFIRSYQHAFPAGFPEKLFHIKLSDEVVYYKLRDRYSDFIIAKSFIWGSEL